MRRAWLLALLVAPGACTRRPAEPAPPPEPRLLTVAPPGAPAEDPVVGLPAGSRLLLVDPARPAAPPLDLAEGFHAAGDACVSFDGTRIAFVARRSADEPFGLWTCRADGTDRRPALASTSDAAAPAWLPDGRLVYAAVVEGEPVEPTWRRAWALHVAPGDATAGQRITFGAGLEVDPCVLRDGRVLYAGWRPAAEGGGQGSLALFTVHPDGTGAALYHGPAQAPRVLRRPRPAPDGSVAYVGGATNGPGRAHRVDARWPYGAPRVEEGRDAVWTAHPTARGALWLAGPGGLWERGSPAGPGDLRPGATPAGVVVLAATDVAPRDRPQGHLSFVDPYATWGQLLALDARFPATPGAARVRVRRWHGPGDADPVVLVEAPLAADGSFFLRLPPDTALLVDVLDAQGAPLRRSTTPIWVRPRESRACVGCHEGPDVAPPNRRPQAVLADALDASGPRPGEAR